MRKLLGVFAFALLAAACGDDGESLSLSGTTVTTRAPRTTTTDEATTTTEAAGPAQPRGCSAERPSSAGWAGPGAPDPATGTLAVDAFNTFLATARPPVSTSPCDAARVFVKADGVTGDLRQEVSPDNAASANVTVTIEGLEDDSVAAERFVLQFVEQPDGTIRLNAAQRTNRCQPGRGPAEFSPALCA